MRNKNFTIMVAIVVLAAITALSIFFGISYTNNTGKTETQLTMEETIEELNRYVAKNVNPTVKESPVKGTVDLESSSLEDELPDIAKYPYKVSGNGDVVIEIFSSPEKAGSETSNGNDPKSDTWLINVVENFNRQSFVTSDGKKISINLRSVSSGVIVDYIVSGKYIPDAITPSNELWVNMLKANGVNLTQYSQSLVENVAGIVISKDTESAITKNYGSVNLETIIQSTINNEIAMGYTNPYASSTGLNFLMSALYNFNYADPLSIEAIETFQSFQANVPVVSYNTTQMQGAINSGVLDAMILEYQTYVNKPELRNYTFVPFGVRHDNPLYGVGNLSEEKAEALSIFAEFATNEQSKKSAHEYGFGEHSDYTPEVPLADGDTLFSAQKIWKDNKDNGQEIVSVFIVDTSGSVDGTPLNNMKTSLINAGQYIKSDSYVGLVSYNSFVTINLPIAKFDLNHRAYFNGEISNFSAGGGTQTFDAIAVGLQMLMKAKEEHPNAKFMLFVLSDGMSNGSLKSVSGYIENLKVPVYTIGYNANVQALAEISAINEAASINADTDDIIYSLKNLFNAQM